MKQNKFISFCIFLLIVEFQYFKAATYLKRLQILALFWVQSILLRKFLLIIEIPNEHKRNVCVENILKWKKWPPVLKQTLHVCRSAKEKESCRSVNRNVSLLAYFYSLGQHQMRTSFKKKTNPWCCLNRSHSSNEWNECFTINREMGQIK